MVAVEYSSGDSAIPNTQQRRSIRKLETKLRYLESELGIKQAKGLLNYYQARPLNHPKHGIFR